MDSHAYLKGLGWRGEGHSLDHHGRGLKKPLLISQKVDVLGLGKKKHDIADQWWMRALDSSLKDIGTGRQTVLSSIKTHGAKQGGLYGFFVKGNSLEGTLSGSEVSTPLLISGTMSPVVATSLTVVEGSVARIVDGNAVQTLDGSTGHDLKMDKGEKKRKRKRDSNAAPTLDGSTEHDVETDKVEKKKKRKGDSMAALVLNGSTEHNIGMDEVEKKKKRKRDSNTASTLDESIQHDLGTDKAEKKKKRKGDSMVASTLNGSTEHNIGMDEVEKKKKKRKRDSNAASTLDESTQHDLGTDKAEKKRKRKRDNGDDIEANGKKRKDKERNDSVDLLPLKEASSAADALPGGNDGENEKEEKRNGKHNSIEVLPLKNASSPADAAPNESGSKLLVDAKATASEKKKKGNKKERPKEKKKERLKREIREGKERRRERKKKAREEFLKGIRNADAATKDIYETAEANEKRWEKRLRARVELLKGKADKDVNEDVHDDDIKNHKKTPEAETRDGELLREVHDVVTAEDTENGKAALGDAAVVTDTAPDFISLLEVTEGQTLKSDKAARRAAKAAKALEKRRKKAENSKAALADAAIGTDAAPDFIPLVDVTEHQPVKSGKAARRAAKVAKALEKRRLKVANNPVKAARLAERERRKATQKAAFRNKKRVKREARRGRRPKLGEKRTTM